MATLYKLPCIFVVENNKWAIGMSHARATGPSGITDNEPFIYKKGPAFGMPGVLVDGMDVRKVRPPPPPPPLQHLLLGLLKQTPLLLSRTFDGTCCPPNYAVHMSWFPTVKHTF